MSEEELKEQFERQARERVEAVRKVFAPLVRRLQPGDEPAPVFRPEIFPQVS